METLLAPDFGKMSVLQPPLSASSPCTYLASRNPYEPPTNFLGSSVHDGAVDCEAPMTDLFFALLTIVFFVVANLFLRGCARLK